MTWAAFLASGIPGIAERHVKTVRELAGTTIAAITRHPELSDAANRKRQLDGMAE
jgi:hypothetical protein